ncbi:hypothetical protein BC332_21168 [Capsicum chinense]|nr:hypothetical protein BC332_21168 [Capsicum chinense]
MGLLLSFILSLVVVVVVVVLQCEVVMIKVSRVHKIHMSVGFHEKGRLQEKKSSFSKKNVSAVKIFIYDLMSFGDSSLSYKAFQEVEDEREQRRNSRLKQHKKSQERIVIFSVTALSRKTMLNGNFSSLERIHVKLMAIFSTGFPEAMKNGTHLLLPQLSILIQQNFEVIDPDEDLGSASLPVSNERSGFGKGSMEKPIVRGSYLGGRG